LGDTLFAFQHQLPNALLGARRTFRFVVGSGQRPHSQVLMADMALCDGRMRMDAGLRGGGFQATGRRVY
jgi:hypothetical protein